MREVSFARSRLAWMNGVLLSAGDDQTARVMKVGADRLSALSGPITGHQDEVTAVAVIPNSRELEAITASDDQTLRMFTVGRDNHAVLRRTLTGARDEVYSLAISPDGETLAAGVRDGKIITYNLAKGNLPGALGPPLVGHEEAVDPVVFSPTGNLATASEDGTVQIWDLNRGAHPEITATLHHEDEVTAAAFSLNA